VLTEYPMSPAAKPLLLAPQRLVGTASRFGDSRSAPHWLARYRAQSLWEVVLVSDGKVTNRAATAYCRCEVGETLQGGHCGLEAEAEFQGLLLCEWHARQSEAYNQIDLLRGIVLSLELCLRNVLLRRDTNLVRLLRYQRAHASQELHRAHEDLRQATKMIGSDRQ
jgi:hypothetical protein